MLLRTFLKVSEGFTSVLNFPITVLNFQRSLRLFWKFHRPLRVNAIEILLKGASRTILNVPEVFKCYWKPKNFTIFLIFFFFFLYRTTIFSESNLRKTTEKLRKYLLPVKTTSHLIRPVKFGSCQNVSKLSKTSKTKFDTAVQSLTVATYLSKFHINRWRTNAFFIDIEGVKLNFFKRNSSYQTFTTFN